MNITFTAAGLVFEADVTFIPGYLGDYDNPPEPEEIEFNSLRCEGSDAEFLMDSTLWLAIETNALEAASEQAREDLMDLRDERHCDREVDLAY